MPDVSVDSDAYQTLSDIRQRIDYEAGDFFNDNEQLRFDELLVELERESRGIFETLWGDETPLTETDRIDVKRATFDAAIMLPYPIQDVSKVELKRSVGSDWDELDSDRYDFTKHRLLLANRSRNAPVKRANELTNVAARTTWRDITAKIRVTYDRGFGSEPPEDIQGIQVQIIEQLLRKRRREQTTAAASPDEIAGMSDANEVVTEEIRRRIADVTKPSGGTLSV
jgi:hypothetical protein